MTEPKFTPGPWQVHHENKVCRVIRDEQLEIIGWCDVNNEANANLIIAAPDMYEALEEVCHLVCVTCSKYERYCESGNRLLAEMPCNTCESKVFKALRKARGEAE